MEGATIQKLDSFYVVIEDIIYKIHSCLKAFDICFKAFHVLNCEYPFESEHIYLIIQLYLCNFKTKFDKKIPIVSTVLSQLPPI